MTNPVRDDAPGRELHLWGRGIAHRPIAEDLEDVLCFESCLEKVSRAGLIQVVSFCILTNHYHLLVRSPVGEISLAMQIALSDYVRSFNRRHSRDGRLFRGPFGSKVIWSLRYLATLIRYVDFNPVLAHMVGSPAEHPHGSARTYLGAEGPDWLARDVMEEWFARLRPSRRFGPDAYGEFLDAPPTKGEIAVVKRRMKGRDLGRDPLCD